MDRGAAGLHAGYNAGPGWAGLRPGDGRTTPQSVTQGPGSHGGEQGQERPRIGTPGRRGGRRGGGGSRLDDGERDARLAVAHDDDSIHPVVERTAVGKGARRGELVAHALSLLEYRGTTPGAKGPRHEMSQAVVVLPGHRCSWLDVQDRGAKAHCGQGHARVRALRVRLETAPTARRRRRGTNQECA